MKFFVFHNFFDIDRKFKQVERDYWRERKLQKREVDGNGARDDVEDLEIKSQREIIIF